MLITRILQKPVLNTQLSSNLFRSMSVKSTYLQFDDFGDPEKVVKKHETSLNSPKGKEVLVKVLAAPINPADINLIQGKYGLVPKLPFVPGNECVAEILECGDEVKNFQVGDHVIPYTNLLGTWRNTALYDSQLLYKVPKELDLVHAATCTVNPPTAYRMLKDFVDLKPGDTVIQNGANSAVGQAVNQLCKIWGFKCVGVVRDRPDVDKMKSFLKSLGATEILTEEEMRTTNLFKSGALPAPKLALNCVGGKSATNILRYLAKKGVMVTYGAMSREALTIPNSALIFKDIAFRGFWMSHWADDNPDRRDELNKDLFKLMMSGEFKTASHKFVSLNDFKAALSVKSDVKGMTGDKILFDFSL